jgi:hypothetical protein
MIHYQGRMLDGTNPVNGIQDVGLLMYTNMTGGTPVYTETQAVTVIDGLYSFCIGASNPAPSALSEALTHSPLYLELEIAGTAMHPRRQMLSSPYAHMAAGTEPAAIETAMLRDQAVTGDKLATNAVTSAHIADGAIMNNDISAAAAIEGAKVDNVLLLDGSRGMSGTLIVSNTIQATSFSGNGAGLTNLDGAAIAAGTVSGQQIASNAVGADEIASHSVDLNALRATYVTSAYARLHDPVPGTNDQYGAALAIVSDWLVIGTPMDDSAAMDAGIVYVYNNTDTDPAQTITNPTPQTGDYFGYALAAFSNNEIIVGCPLANRTANNEGEAFLFRADGTLLTTFTNPTPDFGARFGFSVCSFQDDEVIIGTPYDNGSNIYVDVGSAFSTRWNGGKMRTIHHPEAAANDLFGYTVTDIATNCVAIAAPYRTGGGCVYIYTSLSSPDTVISNPTPQSGDAFGYAMDGSDRGLLLVGAPGDEQGAIDAGCAYLYNQFGTLLQTFTNPVPTDSDEFGHAVSFLDQERIAVSAWQSDVGTNQAGVAYIYDTDQTLLMCLTNPSPQASDKFGAALRGLSRNQVAIGEPFDNADYTNQGSVHLYSIAPKMGDMVADLTEGYAFQQVLEEDGPGSGLDADTLDGLNSRDFLRVRSQGYVAGGSSTNIVIPHYRYFTIQITSGQADSYGLANISGFENDRDVAVTYVLYNGDGTSEYGGAEGPEFSTNTLVEFGDGFYMYRVNLPGESSGDHNLVLTAEDSGIEMKYRLIY